MNTVYREIRELSPKRMIFIKPSSQNGWTKVEEEVERLQEPEVMDDSKETVFSGLNRTDAHMNSGRLWKPSQGLHTFKLDWAPELREGTRHGLLPLTKKLSAIATQWQN